MPTVEGYGRRGEPKLRMTIEDPGFCSWEKVLWMWGTVGLCSLILNPRLKYPPGDWPGTSRVPWLGGRR